MKKDPLVSIIIPTYNVEKYLVECLNSVSAQTYPHFEAIIVDDKSPDSSGKIADEFAKQDPRFKVVHKPKNEGLNMARATGFAASTGEYITFLDSDDKFSPRNLQKALEALRKNSADACRYQRLEFDDNTMTKAKRPATIELILDTKKDFFLTTVRSVFGFQDYYSMTVWGGLYSRKVVSKIDWAKSNYRIYEDNFWTLQLFDIAQKIVIISDHLYYYRVNDVKHAASAAVLSKSVTGNTFNGEPVGYLELVARLNDVLQEYNKKHKLKLDESIELKRTGELLLRSKNLTAADSWQAENNMDYAVEVLTIQNKLIDSQQKEIARLHRAIRGLERELASHYGVKASARLFASNVKHSAERRISQFKANRT